MLLAYHRYPNSRTDWFFELQSIDYTIEVGFENGRVAEGGDVV